MLPPGFDQGGHHRSMQPFAQLEGAFPCPQSCEDGLAPAVSAGLVVIAAQANVMMVRAASERESSDTFAGKCREESKMKT